MFMYSSLGPRQFFGDFEVQLVHNTTYHSLRFERASYGYLKRLNRSSIEEVIFALRGAATKPSTYWVRVQMNPATPPVTHLKNACRTESATRQVPVQLNTTTSRKYRLLVFSAGFNARHYHTTAMNSCRPLLNINVLLPLSAILISWCTDFFNEKNKWFIIMEHWNV